MESLRLDTNVTALLTISTDNIKRPKNVDKKLYESFQQENPILLLAGIGGQVELYLPRVNVSTLKCKYTILPF